MNKTLLSILFVLITFQSYSQQSKICGVVDYEQSTHFSRDFSRDFSLKFNTNHSIYKETNINKQKEKVKQTNEDEGQQLTRDVPRNNITPEFYYNDRQNFHFMEVWFDKELLVKEDAFNWSWNLKNETKKIGEFNCQKATIQFRGREYTAWFTKEIPVPFGPWKFKGLSGLILEIYDADKVFHIIAKKIKIEKKQECKIKIDTLKFKSALTVKQYVKKKIELIKEDFAKLSSRLPKGYSTLVYDENCDDCREEVEKF